MNEADAQGQFPSEVVALIATRPAFEKTVQALLGAGFEHADLSVLASHDSLDAAGKPASPWRDALVAMVGDLRYEGALIASGAIVLAGGPLAATVAGIIGAAVGGIAIKDVLDEVTAKPHTEEFARSLEAGSIILWVRVLDPEQLRRALAVLEANGATNVHVAPPSTASDRSA